MPIHEEAYASWEGAILDKPRTWFVIARTGVRLVWRKLLAVVLFVAAIPFIVRAAQIYIASRLQGQSFARDIAEAIQIDAGFFMKFMKDQTLILIVVIAFCGAGLIVNDRKYRAFPLYFARPVDFWDYVAGKFSILAFYGALITIVPALILFILQLLLTEETGFFAAYYWIPLSILGGGILVLIVLGGLMMAASAVARGARSAVIALFSFIYIPQLLAKILSMFKDVGWISINQNVEQVTAVLFGEPNPRAYSPWVGAVVLAAIVALCIVALKKRVKPTEVVK